MNKLFTLIPTILLIGGCSIFGEKEDKKIETELYILNSKISPNSIDNDISKFDSNLSIENFISKLPSESNSKLMYNSKIESYFNTTTEVSNYNFKPYEFYFNGENTVLNFSGTNTTNKSNEEVVQNLIKDQRHVSAFNFKIYPTYVSNDLVNQKIKYNTELLRKISKKDNGVYIVEYQEFNNDLTNTLKHNKYQVLSSFTLDDNSHIVLIYKSNIKK